jgi:hypothetical protein
LARSAYDLLDGEPEDEDVLVAHLLADLDVGAVERADGQRAVEGELHVAGARGLLAGGGDLLREVGAGNDLLGQRDAVVGQEGDLEPAADARVVIDVVARRVDRADDVLGHVVAGRGLGAKMKTRGTRSSDGAFCNSRR